MKLVTVSVIQHVSQMGPNESSQQQEQGRHTALSWEHTEHVQPDRKQVFTPVMLRSAFRKRWSGGVPISLGRHTSLICVCVLSGRDSEV